MVGLVGVAEPWPKTLLVLPHNHNVIYRQAKNDLLLLEMPEISSWHIYQKEK